MRKIAVLLLLMMSAALMAQEVQRVGASEFEALKAGKVTLIDMRAPEIYMYDHIAGAVWFPADEAELQKRMKGISKKKQVLLYGDAGGAAEKAADEMAAKGFDVRVLDGGVDAWTAAGKELYQFRDTAELYGYADSFGFDPNASGRVTLHLGEKYLLLNIGSSNIYFKLEPDDLIYALEKNGETNLVFRNPEEHYKYVRIELSLRHIHVITTSLQTGDVRDYCFTLERE